MRFVFVDRIVSSHAGHTIEIVKNVAMTEDVFDDHFPGAPILPGALVVEIFEQASQLLIGRSTEFERVGRLERISRGTFHHFVRPGDQVRVRCERRDGDSDHWTVQATASVDHRCVATGTLTFALEDSRASDDTRDQATRLRTLDRVLRGDSLDPRRLGTGP